MQLEDRARLISRTAAPSEIAQAILFLASGRSSYVTSASCYYRSASRFPWLPRR